MLHVFSVTGGHMMTFDVNLAMRRVVELKQVVAQLNSSDPSKQVMLINGGQALEDDEKVHVYAAGTETNPIYVYDKSIIERSTPPEISPQLINSDFDKEIMEATQLRPSYATVVVRTQLAIRINEATNQQLAKIKLLIQDDHLMFQGWQAAAVNLRELVQGFERRKWNMREKCLTLLQESHKYPAIVEGLEEVLQTLQTIPVLPCLSDGKSDVPNLLVWIEQKCQKMELQALLSECLQRCQLLTKDKFDRLCGECVKVVEEAHNTRMLEITGIGKRLSALDHVMAAAERDASEQREITQGFLKNQERARELQQSLANHDALVTFCESHVTQLQLMRDKETGTRSAMSQCNQAKDDLARNLHTRLKWLYVIQRKILNADIKLSMFREQLVQLGTQVEFLSQVKQAPFIYFSFLAECVRRRKFSDVFRQWTNKVLTSSKVARDKEVTLRKKFKNDVGNHFIRQLFPGFADRPPLLSKRPLPEFDLQLPQVTLEQLQALHTQFPNMVALTDVLSTSYDFAAAGPLAWQPLTSECDSMTSTFAHQSQSPTLVFSEAATSSSTSVMSQSASVMSQDTSVAASPTSSALDKSHSLGQGDDSQYSPGSFVVSSVQKLVHDDENSLHSFSAPRLTPPDPGDMIEFGSPDSGEFYSVIPFSLRDGGKETAMSEEQHTGSPQSKGTPSTMFGSSEDEMFHSVTSDLDKQKLIQNLRGIEEEKQNQVEEYLTTIQKLQEQVASLEKSREEVISDFDRRWAESRKELEYVIGQLESEQKERKLAWEKESHLNEENEDLKSKFSALIEENKSLKSDLSSKVQLVSEIDSESRQQKNSIQLEMTRVQEDAERRVWETTQASAVERDTMTKTIETLKRDVELKSAQVSAADDRVQDLESELSACEYKINTINSLLLAKESEIEGAKESVLKSRAAQEEAESQFVTLQKQVTDLEIKLQKSGEQCDSLKTMMAAYEVELNESHEKSELLRRTQSLLEEERAKSAQHASERDSALTEVQKSADKVQTLNRALDHERTALAELKQTLEGELEQVQLEREKAIQEVRESETCQRTKLTEEHEMKMQSIKCEHQQALDALNQRLETDLNEANSNHRLEMDERQADHLAEVVSLQRKLDELQEEYNNMTKQHDLDLDGVRSEHTDAIKRMTEQNERLSSDITKLNEQITRSRSLDNALMTSSMMSLSNEELESKRTKMDESVSPIGLQRSVAMETSMVISVHDHQMSLENAKKQFEAEKLAIKSSYKKKEEDSTKRRQMVFNTAIQQVKVIKNAEIEELKRKLESTPQSTSVTSSTVMTQEPESATPGLQRFKVTVANFRPDDVVLVTYEPKYDAFLVVTLSHTLHFVHSDSLEELGLSQPVSETSSKTWLPATFVEKEYCLARKANNRFKVPVGLKLYRVQLRRYQKS